MALGRGIVRQVLTVRMVRRDLLVMAVVWSSMLGILMIDDVLEGVMNVRWYVEACRDECSVQRVCWSSCVVLSAPPPLPSAWSSPSCRGVVPWRCYFYSMT